MKPTARSPCRHAATEIGGCQELASRERETLQCRVQRRRGDAVSHRPTDLFIPFLDADQRPGERTAQSHLDSPFDNIGLHAPEPFQSLLSSQSPRRSTDLSISNARAVRLDTSRAVNTGSVHGQSTREHGPC